MTMNGGVGGEGKKVTLAELGLVGKPNMQRGVDGVLLRRLARTKTPNDTKIFVNLC